MQVKLLNFDFDFEYTVLLRWQDNFYKVHVFLRLSIDNILDSSLCHNIRTFFLHSDRTFALHKKDIILICIFADFFFI